MIEILTIINTLGLSWLVLRTAQQSQGRVHGAQPIILDSCALIDGRILEISKTGLVESPLIVPQFVLRELQMLADGSDNHKRARARFGLEVAERLIASATPTVVDTFTKNAEKVDEQLIMLAKKRKARLCTTDYNLNKVASAEGIIVINMHELAQAMRSQILPGEQVEIKLLQKGESPQQAVGYLMDGTMVVVDKAARYIGTKQTVTIERSIQTMAGRMCFARIQRISEAKS